MVDKLKEIASKAYVPYSKFHVAAYFKLNDNSSFSGFNIENAAYPNCMCAERVAILSAINNGIDLKKVVEVHIYSPNSNEYLSPCGGCLQTMSEFLNKEVLIYMYNKKAEFLIEKLSTLMPYMINPKNIKGDD